MINWLELSANERNELLGLVSQRTGLPAYAIEKDWWVTLALYAIFRTQWKDNIVFNFLPPQLVMKEWEADYKAMQNDMIYGESKEFNKIIERMILLQQRFRMV